MQNLQQRWAMTEVDLSVRLRRDGGKEARECGHRKQVCRGSLSVRPSETKS